MPNSGRSAFRHGGNDRLRNHQRQIGHSYRENSADHQIVTEVFVGRMIDRYNLRQSGDPDEFIDPEDTGNWQNFCEDQPHVVLGNYRILREEAHSNWEGKSMMGLDGLLRPISRFGADGSLPRYAVPSGSEVSTQPKRSQPPINDEDYNLDIQRDYLDPLTNPWDTHHGCHGGHDWDFVGQDSRSGDPRNEHPSIIVKEYKNQMGYSVDYRPLALRGPLLIQGWGYDLDGKPVPNRSDNEFDAERGIFTDENLQDEFMGNWLKKSMTWPVAPLDLRFDRRRGVWVAPTPYKMICGRLKEDLAVGGNATAYQSQGETIWDSEGNLISFDESNEITVTNKMFHELPSGSAVVCYYDDDTNEYWVLSGYLVPEDEFMDGFTGMDIDFPCDGTCTWVWSTDTECWVLDTTNSDCFVRTTEAPTGACCIDDTCFDLTEADCINKSGEFMGGSCGDQGIECLPSGGACCYQQDGEFICEEGIERGLCQGLGGTFSRGMTCDRICCPPKDDCPCEGENYVDPDATMDTTTTEEPERWSCCYNDGSQEFACDDRTEEECSELGGRFANGIPCADRDCLQCFCEAPPHWFCGIEDGDTVITNCILTDEDQAPDCSFPDPPGQCCLSDGSCLVTNLSTCQSNPLFESFQAGLNCTVPCTDCNPTEDPDEGGTTEDPADTTSDPSCPDPCRWRYLGEVCNINGFGQTGWVKTFSPCSTSGSFLGSPCQCDAPTEMAAPCTEAFTPCTSLPPPTTTLPPGPQGCQNSCSWVWINGQWFVCTSTFCSVPGCSCPPPSGPGQECEIFVSACTMDDTSGTTTLMPGEPPTTTTTTRHPCQPSEPEPMCGKCIHRWNDVTSEWEANSQCGEGCECLPAPQREGFANEVAISACIPESPTPEPTTTTTTTSTTTTEEPIMGACCSNGTCISPTNQIECEVNFNGQFFPNIDCSSSPCTTQEPTGSCCREFFDNFPGSKICENNVPQSDCQGECDSWSPMPCNMITCQPDLMGCCVNGTPLIDGVTAKYCESIGGVPTRVGNCADCGDGTCLLECFAGQWVVLNNSCPNQVGVCSCDIPDGPCSNGDSISITCIEN